MERGGETQTGKGKTGTGNGLQYKKDRSAKEGGSKERSTWNGTTEKKPGARAARLGNLECVTSENFFFLCLQSCSARQKKVTVQCKAPLFCTRIARVVDRNTARTVR